MSSAPAVGARQRVLLGRVGVQEDRKVAADRSIAQRLHLLLGGAHDHPIVLVRL